MVKRLMFLALLALTPSLVAAPPQKNETLKISADANGVRIEMAELAGSAPRLSYDRALDELVLSGSKSKPATMVQTLKNGRKQATEGERFIVSLKTNTFRYAGPVGQPPVPSVGY